jgi:ABC-type multidrug transport system ATPase subunit
MKQSLPQPQVFNTLVCIVKHGKIEIVEKLDELKTSLSELTVTLRNEATDIPKPPGELIHKVQQDRQWRLLVRHARDSEMAEFQQGANVGAVEVKQPSLEDIYVGYMQGDVERDSN